MVIHRKRCILLIPVAASFITIVLFFYIARLRMPMTPFLAIFAGGAISALIKYIKNKNIIAFILSFLLVLSLFFLSNIRLTQIDTSNEWNKAGVVLRVQGKTKEAEKAFFRAMKENNRNPNTYLNLSVLYDKMGEYENSVAMKKEAEKLRDVASEKLFIQNIYDKSDQDD